jgi:aminoglycoside 3-N-acetyltransferase
VSDHSNVRRPAEGGLTREALVDDLRALGVQPGQVLLVHASLRAIGQVDGGAATVVAAIREAAGNEAGTVVMSAATEANSDTSRAYQARIAGMSAAQAAEYRNRMTAFDEASTPATGVGSIAEALRITPGAVRSSHPQSSFAAIGPVAAELMARHPLTSHLGMDSPLGRLYQRDTLILLLGVGYQACSALHLAEYLYTETPPMRNYACVITANGLRQWATYQDVVLHDSDFTEIGKFVDVEADVRRGYVGGAACRLVPMRDTVDCAADWLRRNRR